MYMCVCVSALSKTMTIVSEVLKDFEVNQLPGYQSLFVELQFACMQLQTYTHKTTPIYMYKHALTYTYEYFHFQKS